MNLNDKLETISKWYVSNNSEETNALNNESGAKHFAEIERMVGEELPVEFIEMYQRFNGEKGTAENLFFGHEFLSCEAIIAQLEFSLSLIKPANRRIPDQEKANQISKSIVDLYFKSIPVKKTFGLFTRKWLIATFECSVGSFGGVSVEYGDGQTELFPFNKEYSHELIQLTTQFHSLEKDSYNWDNLEFKFYPDKTYSIERVDYNFDEEIPFTSYPENAIRKKYFHYKWIPIFHDHGGNFIGIDLDPDDAGKKGQIIIFGRDEEDMVVVGENLNDFFDSTISLMTDNPDFILKQEHLHEVYKSLIR